MRDILIKVGYFFVLNPFIGSGLFDFGTDVSIFWLISALFLSFTSFGYKIFFILLTYLVHPHLFIYSLNIATLFALNLDDFKAIIPFTIITWISLFLLEIFYPELRDLLFYRKSLDYSDRGHSGFGPEPATTAFIMMNLIFWIKGITRYVLFFLILLTQVVPIIFLSFIYLFINKRNLMVLFLGMILFHLGIGLNYLDTRANFYIENILSMDFENIFMDESILERLSSIFIFIGLIGIGEVGILQFENIPFVEINGITLHSEISSGILRLFNVFGFFSIPFLFWMIFKLKLRTIPIFILSLFVGSPAHVFPLLNLIRNKYDD